MVKDINEENAILKGLLKGFWEDRSSAAYEMMQGTDLESRIRNAAAKFVNEKPSYTLEEALKYAQAYEEKI